MKLYSSTMKSLEFAFSDANYTQEENAWADNDEEAIHLLVSYIDGVIHGTVDTVKLIDDLQEI